MLHIYVLAMVSTFTPTPRTPETLSRPLTHPHYHRGLLRPHVH